MLTNSQIESNKNAIVKCYFDLYIFVPNRLQFTTNVIGVSANQHHNSPISLVRLDAKGDGSGGGDGAGDEDDDPDSRVNLTVEGYYPPTPAPSSPTPPPTPVADTGISNDGE